jgi:hypothetical protein
MREPLIRRRTDLDVASLIEPIHLVQQLQQDSLYLSVGTSLRIETFRSDRIDLVDKDDRGRVFTGHSEDVSDHSRSLKGRS